MANRRDLVLIVVLLVAVMALAVLTTPDGDSGGFDVRASTFRPAPQGAMALYLTIEGLGVPVERRLTDWVEGPPLQGTQVLLAPSQALTPFEVDALADWVHEGGTLIAGVALNGNEGLLEALGLVVQPIGGAQPAVPAAPHAWNRDSAAVEGFRWRFSADSPALADTASATILHTASGREPVVVTFPLGAGRVMAWSDVGPLINDQLRESGAAIVFARAAADLAAAHAPVVFDEYHHGYREGAGPGRATLQFLVQTAPGWMTLQFAVVAAGLLWLYGRRFGAPAAPPPPRRRSPIEHVEALAGAYRQGAARLTAARLVLAGLARRLNRPAPTPGTEEAWLRQLAARAGAGAEQAGALEAQWRRGADMDLAALARHADARAQERM